MNSIRFPRRWTVLSIAGLSVAVWAQAAATVSANDAKGPLKITVSPESCVLIGGRAEQRVVVTGYFANDEVLDLTADATFEPAAAEIVRAEDNFLHPVADGTTTVTVRVGIQTASVAVESRSVGEPSPVSFHNETLAALTKSGCNMGACHGSPSGKGGFRLSLRGYDAPFDMNTLRTEFAGRRANVAQPDESLLLKKPLMEVPHGGGQRLLPNDPSHKVLRTWIAEGMKVDPPGSRTLVRLEVYPHRRIFRDAGNRQQVIVNGYFSDGTVRDVTALTDFSSSAESVAKVDANGLVKKIGRGEATILARYLDKIDTSAVTFLETVPGFAWNNSPEFNFIDRLANDKLKQLQILPSDLCSDDEFQRRAYLDAIGRLPTLEETHEFMNDLSDDKRAKLVDHLLETKDYAAFWTMKWADVLRANTNRIQAVGVHKFHDWIYEGVYSDQPMDEFARELLTANGSVFENPAANYWRSSREPTDAVETTAQLFLGIRIQCAKCHNHPFERWSQDNYYGLGAAFVRVGRKPGRTPNDEIIFPATSGEVVQPRTGKTMKVHLLLKGDVDVPPDQDRREVFAEWLTAPENPFFSRSLVNRIWGHLMGRGIVDPVDDFRDSNPPSNAPLLDELARQFADHGFSRKWLVRTIMNSHTYQRSARTNEFNKDDEIYFSHMTTRMLSAEQLLDSICEVTAVPESFPGMPPGTRATQLAEPPADNYFLKIFGQPQREMACECERSNESNLSQALQMINGPTVHNKLRDDAGRINQSIVASKSNDEIITELYLAAVCRTPTTQELEAARKHVESSEDRRMGLEDVGWAVLNTKEFLFQH
jgi:hypothetical protein